MHFQNWLAKIEGDSLDVCVCVYPMRRILYTLQFHPQLAKTILPTLNYKYRWWWDEKYICFISILALLLFKGVLWRGVGCTVGVVQWSTWPCSADRQNLQTATGQLKLEFWDLEFWKLWGSFFFAVVEHHLERFSTECQKSWNQLETNNPIAYIP